ncbi:MAG: response regulator [Bryobacteraceae bacterium]
MDRIVLIVEDAEPCATMLEIALMRIREIDVRVVFSGEEALELLRSASGRVAAIITDIHLPRMDGLELIKRVRAWERYSQVPIIVISGDTNPGTPGTLRRLGANAYFVKPYSPAEVRRKLESFLDAKTTNTPD